jgi:hypothetical protein
MVGGGARDETEDIPAILVDSQMTRRIGKADRVQEGQHLGGKVRPSTTRAPDGIGNPDDLMRIVSSGQAPVRHKTEVALATTFQIEGQQPAPRCSKNVRLVAVLARERDPCDGAAKSMMVMAILIPDPRRKNT